MATFGPYGECEAHHRPITALAAVAKAKATRFCRKAACVEAALGHEFVGHAAGTCG